LYLKGVRKWPGKKLEAEENLCKPSLTPEIRLIHIRGRGEVLGEKRTERVTFAFNCIN